MTEYEQLSNILSEEFLSASQDIMIEEKECTHKRQTVKIDDGNRRNLVRSLYRFDLEEKDFLPFFNKTHGASEGLRKFCDYVLLVKYREKTYVLLIELKRGDTSGAYKQLNASEIFIEFIYKTAERLYKDFKDFSFNSKNIILHKIIIKEIKSNKTVTKGLPIETNKDIILFKSTGMFPLAKFLNLSKKENCYL